MSKVNGAEEVILICMPEDRLSPSVPSEKGQCAECQCKIGWQRGVPAKIAAETGGVVRCLCLRCGQLLAQIETACGVEVKSVVPERQRKELNALGYSDEQIDWAMKEADKFMRGQRATI